MSKRQQVLDAIERIESLPATATHLVHLLADPEAKLDDVRRCVELDPALAANILRICNSAAFAGRACVSSIYEAIVRLGTQRVLNLALTQGVTPLRKGELPGYELAPGELWRHSVGVAVCAEALSRALGGAPAQELFTAGLLHDVGKLVIGLSVREEIATLLSLVSSNHITFEDAERQVLGIDHTEAGALLLTRWGLPDTLSYSARWHHEPDAAPEVSHTLDLVHAADILVLGMGLGMGADGLYYHVSENVATRLQLNASVLETTAARLFDGLATMGVDIAAA